MPGTFQHFEDQPPDAKIPSWDGTGGPQGLEKYERYARAYVMTFSDDTAHLAAPKLWRNLRGQARMACELLDVNALRDPGGIDVLIQSLRLRYPETNLKRRPRLY